MNTFLPAGYEIPEVSNYMKFENGENRFRALSSAITGFEYWVTDPGTNKRAPKRVRPNEPIPVEELELNPKTGEPEFPKHFWAFVVWNYKAKKIQILEITQKGIQKHLKNLAGDEDWGSPLGYDVVVKRSGEGLETEYEVIPKPAKPVEDGILEELSKTHVDLEALYQGKDPFKKDQGK